MNKVNIRNRKRQINKKTKGLSGFIHQTTPCVLFENRFCLSQIGLEQLTTRIGS